MKLTIPAVITLAALAGCSPAAASANCLPVTDGRAALLLGQDSLTIKKAAAVKSTEHENAYYVAIKFTGDGLGDEVGVWATNDIESGTAYSVDGFAEEFSGLPRMDGFSVTDAGASAAKSCVA